MPEISDGLAEKSLSSDEIQAAIEYRDYVYQIGKFFWKMIENEWNDWLQSSNTDLTINEYTILSKLGIYTELCMTEISKIGMMHISTSLNFSKKLEEKGYIELYKAEKDKRTTYARITQAGREHLREIDKCWNPKKSGIVNETLAIEQILGEKPRFKEELSLIRGTFGKDLIEKMLKTAH